MKSKSHYDTNVQPEVTLREIPPVSDSGPRIEVAQTRIEQTRFCVICAVHTVLNEIGSESLLSSVGNVTLLPSISWR